MKARYWNKRRRREWIARIIWTVIGLVWLLIGLEHLGVRLVVGG